MAEYIVDGAGLRCNKGKNLSSLKVPNSRLCITGKPVASQQDCVPVKNIGSFGQCMSETYGQSAKAVKGKEHPCVLDLMEKYYLPDEAHYISDDMQSIGILEQSRIAIREIISDSVNDMREVQHMLLKKMNDPLMDGIVGQYKILWQRTSHVSRLRDGIEEIRQAVTTFYSLATQNYAYLNEGNTNADTAGLIAAALERLKKLQIQADILAGLPPRKDTHPITLESFAVCRCGGILTFVSSGQ